MECTKCGTELDFRDAFCSKCGEVTDRGKGPGELAGRYVAELAGGLGKLIAATLGYVTIRENRTKVGVGTGVALLLLISLTSNPISRGVGSMFASTPNAPTFNDDGSPNFAEYEDVFVGDETEYFVTGTANIRDFPTSQGTGVIGTLAESERVIAREVRAFDPDSRWLKLTTGGYVWGSNLAPTSNQSQQSVGTQQNRLEFPQAARGLWTTMETCHGAANDTEVMITEDSFSYERAYGKLISIETSASGHEMFVVQFKSTAETWSDQLALTVIAHGKTLIVNRPQASEPSEAIYYLKGVGCEDVLLD